MIVFNSDLDNTLIYSYKRDIGKNKKCVEIYENREISYMTDNSINMLEKISNIITFIPTTTRTEEQYKRIFFTDKVKINYALVCNGGVLIENGIRNDIWYKESLDIISYCKNDLDYANNLLNKDKYRNFDLKNIDNLFLFTKSSNPIKTIEYINKNLKTKNLNIFNNGNKIYALPKKLNKGNAIIRLKNKLKSNYIISAGDSIFDIPMVLKSDKGFLHNNLKNEFSNIDNNIIFFDNKKIFSENILYYIYDLIIKND